MVRVVDTVLAVCAYEVGVVGLAFTATTPGREPEETVAGVNYLYVFEQVLPALDRRRRSLIDNEELLPLYRAAWEQLDDSHIGFVGQMVGVGSDVRDDELAARGLTGAGLNLKYSGFSASLREYVAAPTWFQRRKWFRGVLAWADIVLGSLSSLPPLTFVIDPLKEWKEAVEAQVNTENGRRARRKKG